MLKGAKLRLDAEIGSLAIGDGDFIVLVPFTRTPQQHFSVCTASQDQGHCPPKQPEVSSAANSAWQDIMDDLSAMPASPQSDAASKDLYSSCDPCSGRFTEDMKAGQISTSGSSRKRRKTCKENGNGSPQMVSSSEANGTAEKHNISKKSGVAKSAAMLCHVCITSFFLSAIVNFILVFITWRRNPNDRLVFLAQEKCNTHMAYILTCHTYFSLRSWIAF